MTKKGFTLIELLIVIAIILILIAIALPNFLEAQIRSRVVRAHADIRTLATVVEEYTIDHGQYPLYYDEAVHGPLMYSVPWNQRLIQLTTPVPYIEPVPTDIFRHAIAEGTDNSLMDDPLYWAYLYNRGDQHVGGPDVVTKDAYCLLSAGPDNNIEIASYWRLSEVQALMEWTTFPAGRYSATNGTASRGDILYWAGSRATPD